MASDKVRLNPFVVGYPMPVSVLGTELDGSPTFMALAWVSRVNGRPPMMAAAVGRNHATYEAVRASGAFSISFPSEDHRIEADYVGISTARRTDKSTVFTVFYGELPGAPMVQEAPVTLECRLVQSMELPSNTLFIGEVVSAWGDPDVLDEDGRPDLARTRPLLLSMPDNRYWGVGEPVGRAWHDGKGYKGKQ